MVDLSDMFDCNQGTRPSMSAEILGNRYYFSEGVNEQPGVGVVASIGDDDNEDDEDDEDECRVDNHGVHGYDEVKNEDGNDVDEDKDGLKDEDHSSDDEEDDEGDKRLAAVHGPLHSVIHDLEGFFWVLLWVCISRSGPATCRKQLNDPDPSSMFYREWSSLFEGDSVVMKMLTMTKSRTAFVTWLTRFLPSYHKPLTQLLAD